MKFVAISDTHGCHRQLNLPKGDVLLHAGDVCDQGNVLQVEDFLDWLSGLDFQHKVIIGGNHDIDLNTKRSLLDRELPRGIVQLKDSGITIENILIWGIPHPINGACEDWQSIPFNTRILMTHRPPFSILDQPLHSPSKGSKKLMQRVKLVKPDVHLFGHIHASYGQKKVEQTLFINGSAYKQHKKRIVNQAVVFSIENELIKLI